MTLLRSAAVVLLAIAAGGCAGNGARDTDEQSRTVRIVRDDFGVPHVYAPDLYGLYFGYGYAVAQDRLYQMEMARRSTQGTVAAVLGADFLDYDKSTRRLFDPRSIRRQLRKLSPPDSAVFTAYAAGMNHWLAEIRQSPQALMPKQFIDLAFEPSDWTAYDVAMIFIGTMNNRYGDFNTELENATVLRQLAALHGDATARRLFDLLNPRFTDNAPTTIPRADWSRRAPDELDGAATRNLPLANVPPMPAGSVISGMSNCYVLGGDKVAGARAVLINGPQFGWFNPSYVYSVGLHGAGIDVVGNTPFAYPMIMFGHNERIAWGSTWGAGDIVDMYAEQLDPEDPARYFHNGAYVALDHRVERIEVRDGVGVDLDVYRSVHGPIVHRDADASIAYAKRRAWDGGELATLLAWLRATWADDYDEWMSLAAQSAINVNMYYADVEGNIGYFHGGGFPDRVAGHDNRFPARGDGSMEWQGRRSIDIANPHVLNPTTGFLANWNNKPGHGVLNPDFHFYSWSAADRVDFLNDALASQQRFTPQQAWAIIESSSYADVYARYFLPLIDAAVSDSDPQVLQDAAQVLRQWNRESRDADRDGFYDGAATALFRVFVDKVTERVLADDLGPAFAYFSATGYPTAGAPSGAGTNLSAAVKAVVEALHGRAAVDVLNGQSRDAVVRAALGDAVAQLSAAQGVPVAELRLPVVPRPFSPRNFLGVPQAGDDERMIAPIEQNRGTENNMIVMNPGAIVGWEVTPPGQNAFIDRDGRPTRHYDDQFEMYQLFEKKRMWFYRDDVESHRSSETIMIY